VRFLFLAGYADALLGFWIPVVSTQRSDLIFKVGMSKENAISTVQDKATTFSRKVWKCLPKAAASYHGRKETWLYIKCYILSVLKPFSNKTHSMKFSRAESRLRIWRFSDVSGNNSVIFILKCFPKRRKIFTSWPGCLPEKLSLNTVAAKASGLKQHTCLCICVLCEICRSWLYVFWILQCDIPTYV